MHEEARALITSSEKRRPADDRVSRLPKTIGPLRARVAAGLVARGVLREEHAKRLGLFATVRYPIVDDRDVAAARGRLLAVLAREAAPTERDALLLGLLERVDLVERVTDGQPDPELLELRAMEVAKHGLVGKPRSSASSEGSVSNDLQQISDLLD